MGVVHAYKLSRINARELHTERKGMRSKTSWFGCGAASRDFHIITCIDAVLNLRKIIGME